MLRCLLLRKKAAPGIQTNPKGGAQDVRPAFRITSADRGMDAESENARNNESAGCGLWLGHFFGDFLCASKESYPRFSAEAF